MRNGKPTVEEILELYETTKNRYDESGIFSQFDEDDQFYECDFASLLLLPKEFKNEGIVLPTARDIVDTCVDHTNIYNPRVYVNKKGESEKSKEEAELLRKFGLGVLHRNNVEASISPLRVGDKHYWTYGLSVFKTVWDADRWVDRPERREDESENEYAGRVDEWRANTHDSIPIVIQSPHPQTIMLDPFYDGGLFVFETREELAFNVKGNFPRWSNPENRKLSDKVEHISFWTKNYRCELYDKEPVLKVRGGVAEHSYGFIPYVPIDTGLGNISKDNDLKKRYVGVLRYIKQLLLSESRNYSIADVILKRTAFPWGYLKGPNADKVTSILQHFGEYNPLPDGVEIVDMAPKVPPEALLTWIGVAADYLAAHAAPRTTRGLGEQGVRSGADRRLLLAEASTRYQYSNEAFKNGVAKVLANCARIMKNVVPGDINVWARTPTDEFDIAIKKDKMKEPFTFYVDFAPVSEEDEYRRHDDLERMISSGMVSADWARRQLSNVDADAMAVDMEVQKMLNDPQFNQIVSQYIGYKVGQAFQQRSGAEMASGQTPAVAQPGQAPVEAGRRLVPPIPNRAPSGSAQEIQNRLKSLRSPNSMTQQGVGGGGNRP